MDLKEYLSKLKELETSLYEQNNLWISLKQQADNMYANRKVWQTERTLSEPIFSMSDGGCAYVLTIPLSIYLFISSLGSYFGQQPALFIFKLILSIIMIFTAPVIAHIKNKKEVERINNSIYTKNEHIREDNRKEEDLVKKKIAIIQNEMDIVSQNYYDTNKILEQLYAYNIIYPKYRGLIPICAFYEYFMSGRCDCLEGHEGAYNIYENELRQNIIIGKLDTVINRLDEIKNNQYILYQSINESNSNVQSISQQVMYMSQNLNSISNNSQITAYNSGIAAKNSEFLKWMEIYKSM